MHRPSEPKIHILMFFDFVTSDDVDLTRRSPKAEEGAWKYTRHDPRRFIGFFIMIQPLCPATPPMTYVKKLTFVLTYDVISDLQLNFRNIFGKFLPGDIKCPFRIENRSSSLSDRRGRHLQGGRVREYPTGRGPSKYKSHDH